MRLQAKERPMTSSVVGNREGEPVVRWSGVLLSVLIISGVYSVPIAGFYWGVGYFNPASFIFLPVFLLGIIGTSIVRGLRRPVAELPAVA
jgi:hypothetical protein